ncbi:MAG: hypothetical protein C7B46_16590 [Sulfobacillus benefaciens]|uniref:Uncharacterized protein n=1 Tax=Sulfobacillus benefaciens TaxID=453960 RepID=A0A2T2XAY8_9FIRM|nr:MAG: hypothetical protein C7B46_16590 [Sulfobacillus benefaciens]
MRRILAGVGLLGAGLLFLTFWGWRQVTVWSLSAKPQVVWQSRFGKGADDVADAIGLDGRRYGPLAFGVVGNHVVVADSYHHQIVYTGPVSQRVAIGSLMVEDLAVSPSGSIILADNRQLTVWELTHGKLHEIIQVPRKAGVTQAIWHIAVGAHGQILLQIVTFGHGQFEMQLNEYSPKGTFIRELAHAQGGQGLELTPLAGHGPLGLIRDFEVSPSGELYVEPPSNLRFQRQIDIYHWDGRYAGQVIVSSPEPIQENQFLGVNRWGWVYVGVNLNQPHQARVLVVSPHGEILHDLAVHPIPIYSALYGRVTANGTLYLVQSTVHRYRIFRWPLQSHHVWRWYGWHDIRLLWSNLDQKATV